MAQIKANGVRLEYDEQGPKDGAPILLIMGFGAQMTNWPEEFPRSLADAGLRVIRFDNRDVGLSQKFDGILPDAREVRAAVTAGKKPDIPYTLDDMAADAASLLDELGIQSAHILGGSMGGMIAQLVALNRPAKTRSLISIFSTTGDPSLPPAKPEAMAALTAKPPAADRASVIAHTLKGRSTYASTAFADKDEVVAARIGANYDRSYYPEGTVRQMAAIVAASPRADRLKKLAAPALVLHGSVDALIPPEGGRHTAQCIPGAKYHEIEGWGHDIPQGVIPLLMEQILPFVAEVEARR
jgi:pimeloyl-ACP methyl ester carboxylesterase